MERTGAGEAHHRGYYVLQVRRVAWAAAGWLAVRESEGGSHLGVGTGEGMRIMESRHEGTVGASGVDRTRTGQGKGAKQGSGCGQVQVAGGAPAKAGP